ncbi:MAG: Glyceraldehyde-3-phosphate:ferredoxin oxidoreductase [Candidatus Woesearchaeota archaeon]|nr:Glyceraldehyde-3-phosphate:ferredoxin oxidoreductase [Candidatus Woesearchaeota archaeon]
MIQQKALLIDAASETWEVKKVRDEKIIGPVDFGFHMNQKQDYFCFGVGVLAGSPIPGTHRLIFSGISPIWKTFYISTMGGAGLKFVKLGINYVAIKNKFAEPCILRLHNFAGKIHVQFEPVDAEKVWKGYDGDKGVYALQQYALDKCKECHARNVCDSCRVIASGPSAKYTDIGALGSSVLCKGKVTGVDCWAGRGGLGSKLFQQHNIAAIVYGGDYSDDSLQDIKKINAIFVKGTGRKMMLAAMDATKKYRYDDAFESGGTFGVNITKLKDWLLYLNWSSIYMDNDKRLEIYKRLVHKHYLKQFNEETIKTKSWKNCGEACPAVCKKMRGKYKKDYEPYEALGPNCGIFDQRAAEKVNHLIDSMGFDAIQAGNIISWIMELVYKKIIPKQDFDLKLTPRWDLDNFKNPEDSMHNAAVVEEIANMIFTDKGKIFRNGIRKAAKALDKKYNVKTIDLALYTPHSKEGCIAPNQYWVPAFFSPMPIQGKYFEDYSAGFKQPFELGKSSADRMIKELYNDNTGICRFHRKWVEKVIQDIVNELFDQNIDYYEHHKRLAGAIDEVHNESVFWESERVIDVIMTYLNRLYAVDKDNKALEKWIKRFEKDKWKAAKEYWNKLSKGIETGLRSGSTT